MHFMYSNYYDTIVIGNGLFGSAAAVCLAKAGQKVLLAGPDEATRQNQDIDIFSSHYDAGRVTRIFGWDAQWTEWNYETQKELFELEVTTGIKCYENDGCLYVTTYPDDKQPAFAKQLSQHAEYEAYPVKLLTSDELQQQYALYNFDSVVSAYIEQTAAGHLNPRRLIAARNLIFKNSGGTIIREKIITTETGNGCKVTTADRTVYTANQMLICCGAFHNFLPGIPQLDLILKSETVLLAKVSEQAANNLSQLPALLYEIETPEYEGVYMIKPILYPDGNYYLKIGANLHSDIFFTSQAQIKNWFNNTPPAQNQEILVGILEKLLPGLSFSSYTSKPCIITRTLNRRPFIEAVEKHLYVCTGGNGYGAMSSGGIGKAAASLIIQ